MHRQDDLQAGPGAADSWEGLASRGRLKFPATGRREVESTGSVPPPTSNSCGCSSELLERLGYSARIVDFRFFEFSDLLRGKHDYLLEITRDYALEKLQEGYEFGLIARRYAEYLRGVREAHNC